jgi:hypothetical protein
MQVLNIDRFSHWVDSASVLDVVHFAMDHPHPSFLIRGSEPLTIDACEADATQNYARQSPKGGFAGRFFVYEWNAFIHFAAREARLTWLGST